MTRWSAVALLIVGCTGQADPRPRDPVACAARDLEVRLGTGTEQYEPLTDGAQVRLNHGPQGGWHVWIAVDATGSEPNVAIQPRITVPDLDGIQITGHQSAAFVALTSYDPAACRGEAYAMQAYVDTDSASVDALCAEGFDPACDGAFAMICALDGHPLHVEVTLANLVDGRSAEDAVDVVAALDPLDVGPCLAR